MATYTITINERTKQGKSLRDYLQALGIIKTTKKGSLDEALEDVRKGNVYEASSIEELIKQLNA